MVISELTEAETRVLRVLYDRDGEAAFDDAASTILIHTAALIGHVRGPRRLRELLRLIEDVNAIHEIPHMKTCPDCNGDGVIEKGTDDEQQCPTCRGSGFVADDDDGQEEVIHTRQPN